MPGGDLVVDLAHADRVGPEHQPAAIAREAEAVEPHHIDVAGPQCLAFVEDLAGLVDRGEQHALQDLVVGEAVLRDAELGGSLLDDARDLRVGMRGAVAGLVAIPALAVLLAEPPGLDDAVGDRQFAVVRVLRRATLAHVVADVETRQIGHGERPERIAEIDHHLVDLLGQCAFLEHDHHLGRERAAAAVRDKTVGVARERADLADLAAQGHRRRQHIGGAVAALHDFEELHDIGRREEMGAGDVLRPLRLARHDVDVDAGSVREQQRARFHRRIDLLPDLLLDRDLLEHRLDHDVAIGDGVVIEHRLDARQALFHLLRGQAAALDAGFIIAADALHAAVERLLRRVGDLHGVAVIGKAHRDAAAHCAGADHRGDVGRPQWRVARDVGQFGGLALGEEGVAQGARLFRIDLLLEEPALADAAFVEGQGACRLDRLDAGVRRALVLRARRAIDLRNASNMPGSALASASLSSRSRMRGNGR